MAQSGSEAISQDRKRLLKMDLRRGKSLKLGPGLQILADDFPALCSGHVDFVRRAMHHRYLRPRPAVRHAAFDRLQSQSRTVQIASKGAMMILCPVIALADHSPASGEG